MLPGFRFQGFKFQIYLITKRLHRRLILAEDAHFPRPLGQYMVHQGGSNHFSATDNQQHFIVVC